MYVFCHYMRPQRIVAEHILAHSYQYSFEPNPKWSSFYAPAEEICEYLTGVATKYGVQRFVKLSHKVQSCVWDEEAKKW